MPPASHKDNSRGGAAGADLGARMAHGAAWVIAMRWSIRGLGLLSTIVLARLLEPADYGLIALATVIAGAAELLCNFNFEVWLIRLRDPRNSHYNTVWTLSIIRGALTAILLWLAAPHMAAYYEDQRLTGVIGLIAVAILVSSLKNIGIVDFQRELRFDRDYAFNASVKLGAFAVTIILGFLWRNYWALACGIATSHVLSFLLSYRMHSFRPRLSLRHLREAVDFSKWLFAGSLLSFVHLRADTFILGKIAGGQVLGLYNVARDIATIASAELVTPIRRVMLPGYSELQEDLPALSRSFVSGFGLIVLVGMPCAVGLSVAADPLVRTLLGPKWVDAIPMMQAFAVYGVSMIGMANQWPALVAAGRTRIASVLLAFGLLLLLPSFYFASQRYGAVGGALALGASNTALFLAGLIAVRKVLQFRLTDLWRNAWRTVIATLAMALLVLAIQPPLNSLGLPVGLILAACVSTGIAVYTTVLYLLLGLAQATDGPEKTLIEYLRERLRGRRRQGA